MKLSLKSLNNKNKSALKLNINSYRKQNPKKIISSRKNHLSKKTSNENSNTLAYSNSKLDVKNTSNINKNDSSFINSNKFMNIDNIDESNYNRELFLIPKKTNRRYYTSNMEKAVDTYNEIKNEINMKIYNKKIFNSLKSVQIQNYSMVNLLEKLNKVLDTIVERSRYNINRNNGNKMAESQEIIKNKDKNNEKKKISEKDINNKLLNSYIQQYNLLSAKFDKLTNGNYALNLRTNIINSSEEIAKLEKENRELKRTQSRTALILKNLKASKDEINYKKKLEEYDKLFNEYDSINKNIRVKEGELQANEKRIKRLEEIRSKLIKTANECKIEKPEELIVVKKNDKDIEKIKLYIKRKELENKVLIVNNTIKKMIIMEKDNRKYIRELEENITNRNIDLKIKKEELNKLNEILEKIDIENINTKGIFETELKYIKTKTNSINELNTSNENNIIQNYEKDIQINEFNKIYKQKGIKGINISHPEIKIKDINNRYSIKKENISQENTLQTAKTYNKKMILQNLDDQKRREQDNFNKIKLNKKNLKPNFSFSLNNSAQKDKQEKNVNLSVALISNRNKKMEEKNETEGEIKEDINITPYDEKIKTEEEEQRIITNMSKQNISTDKDKKMENELEKYNEEIIMNLDLKNSNNENSGERNRQNALNTLPFYEMEESEKNNKTDNNNINEENINNNNDSNRVKDINEIKNDKEEEKEINQENDIKKESEENEINEEGQHDNDKKENEKKDDNDINEENQNNDKTKENGNNEIIEENQNFKNEENKENEDIKDNIENKEIDNNEIKENEDNKENDKQYEDSFLKDENNNFQDEEINEENLLV